MADEEETIGDVLYHLFRPDDCSICYQPIATGTPCATHKRCGKSWHEDCLMAWITRKQVGTCPNCRANICFAGTSLWDATNKRIRYITQSDYGVWTYGSKGYIRSKLESQQPPRPLKINRRLARYLDSPDCNIRLLPRQGTVFTIFKILPMIEPESASVGILDQSQKDWLQERIRLANADVVHHQDTPTMNDSGWRVHIYSQKDAMVAALVWTKPERRADERFAQEAYSEWSQKPPCDQILARPCSAWPLDNYDEAYIFAFKPGRELSTMKDLSRLKIRRPPNKFWDEADNFLTVFHKWEKEGLRSSGKKRRRQARQQSLDADTGKEIAIFTAFGNHVV